SLARDASSGLQLRFSHARFGSKADICGATAHVRFTPSSDIVCVWKLPSKPTKATGACCAQRHERPRSRRATENGNELPPPHASFRGSVQSIVQRFKSTLRTKFWF